MLDADIPDTYTVYDGPTDIPFQQYFQDFVLPAFGITGTVGWQRHVQTDPDNFVHTFTVGGTRYALAFDDFPSGFSVEHSKFVHTIRYSKTNDVLAVRHENGKYFENVTGYFMLFEVTHDQDFDAYMEYLEMEYFDLRKRWDEEQKTFITVSRDIVQLAQVASINHDTASLYSLRNIISGYMHVEAIDNNLNFSVLHEYVEVLIDKEFGYEMYDESELKKREDQIFAELGREPNHVIAKSRQVASSMGQMVTLIAAMYIKRDKNTTSGTSIALVADNTVIEYPMNHFLDDELREYFANNSYINESNIEQHLPTNLGEYSLVEGSVEIRHIFRRELGHISF